MNKFNNNYINGRSGSKIELIKNDDLILLRKYSNSVMNNNRFLKQINKQRDSALLTPKIYNISINNDLYFCDMEYINGINYFNYFNYCKTNEVINFFDNKLSFLIDNIKNSISVEISQQDIINKINSVYKNIKIKDKIIDLAYNYLKRNMPNTFILSGTCHGDLNFSNMKFHNNVIYFFDFLDSHIESPIIDIVKLRQDTKYYYTPFINNDSGYKIIQILNYIDGQIQKIINNNNLNIWYNYLQVLNFFRILPYLSNRNEITFILNIIKCQVI